MITFKNGKTFEFGCASGALAYNGRGWWFERPWHWLGMLRHPDMSIITKTLTFKPRKGNLRWWCPWRSVRLLPDASVVNAVALTNPGYVWWVNQCYYSMARRGLKIIPSIMAENIEEMRLMIAKMNTLHELDAIQINPFCPNIEMRDDPVGHAIELCQVARKESVHPLIVKLTWQNDYPRMLRELDGVVDAFELINSVPFPMLYRDKSPLSKYGYAGAVSGKRIAPLAREALIIAQNMNLKTPIISGGGIDSLNELLDREAFGAKGFVFGSVFIRKPWRPRMIIDQYYQWRNGAANVE